MRSEAKHSSQKQRTSCVVLCRCSSPVGLLNGFPNRTHRNNAPRALFCAEFKSCLSDSPDATLHFYPHSVEKSIDIPGKIGYNKTKEQTPADRRRKGNDHRRDLSWRLYFRHGEAG
jgi:hypothetical protein